MNLQQIVSELMEKEGLSDAAAVHAALWPDVCAAVRIYLEESPAPVAPADRRTRPWQYVARFWEIAQTGPELVAETDPAVMDGTGQIPGIVISLAAELHECHPNLLPADLTHEALRERLPQLRVNLGRSPSAALRIPYAISEGSYLCQLDVYRLGS